MRSPAPAHPQRDIWATSFSLYKNSHDLCLKVPAWPEEDTIWLVLAKQYDQFLVEESEHGLHWRHNTQIFLKEHNVNHQCLRKKFDVAVFLQFREDGNTGCSARAFVFDFFINLFRAYSNGLAHDWIKCLRSQLFPCLSIGMIGKNILRFINEADDISTQAPCTKITTKRTTMPIVDTECKYSIYGRK